MGNSGNCWTARGGTAHPVTDAERSAGAGTHMHYEHRTYPVLSSGQLGPRTNIDTLH